MLMILWGCTCAVDCATSGSAGDSILKTAHYKTLRWLERLTSAGVILAGVCSILLLFAPAQMLPISDIMRAVTLVGVWGSLGIVWFALRCVSPAMRSA